MRRTTLLRIVPPKDRKISNQSKPQAAKNKPRELTKVQATLYIAKNNAARESAAKGLKAPQARPSHKQPSEPDHAEADIAEKRP